MTTMMMDRNAVMGGTMTAPMTGTMPAQAWMMMPRCTYKFEKVAGGMKMICQCDDPTACSMMQNLCGMMAGGTCSLCVMMNGMMVCTCSLTMGMCKCEMMKNGCTITCMSGDQKMCDMIQACCDCVMAM
ncbi:MAG: hypothetical protein K2W96_28545, partial [Gemmataceae bacterium]|nr:hypothetical protein [Gemmataceae bacterium]